MCKACLRAREAADALASYCLRCVAVVYGIWGRRPDERSVVQAGARYDGRADRHLQSHIKIETTQPGEAPIKSEEVYALNAYYKQVIGRWIKTATSPNDERAGEEKLDVGFTDCHKLPDATMANEPVSVYTAKT